MRVDTQRRARVGDQIFVSQAVTIERGGLVNSHYKLIIGYESDQWAVPGGGVWDSSQLEAYAKRIGCPVIYGVM